MEELSVRTFYHFRPSQFKIVKLLLRSHEGVAKVKKTLIDFLATYNDREWVDWENIEFVLRDLDRLSFWRMLPYQKFLTEAESKVSAENMEVLVKIPY